MRISVAFVALMLLFSACGSKEEEKVSIMDEPADLIEQEKMIQVIADVHLLEAALQYRAPRVQSHAPFSISPVEQTPAPSALPAGQKTLPYYDVFAKHGVTHDQYERSLQWYMTDAEVYGGMYDEVINELVRRQAVEQQKSVAPKADTSE